MQPRSGAFRQSPADVGLTHTAMVWMHLQSLQYIRSNLGRQGATLNGEGGINSGGIKAPVGNPNWRRFVFARALLAIVDGHMLKPAARAPDKGALQPRLVVAQLEAGKAAVVVVPENQIEFLRGKPAAPALTWNLADFDDFSHGSTPCTLARKIRVVRLAARRESRPGSIHFCLDHPDVGKSLICLSIMVFWLQQAFRTFELMARSRLAGEASLWRGGLDTALIEKSRRWRNGEKVKMANGS